MKLQDTRVLLTGATGGIGRALAGQLAQRGARMVLVGRDREQLAPLAARLGAETLLFDLAATDGYAGLAGSAIRRLGGIDLLVNAAGVSHFGALYENDPSTIQRLVTINLIAPMSLCAAVIPHMRSGARIVNVGSVFGAIGFPYFTAYSATKFGLRGFSEALRRELGDRGIGVTYVAPRATRTPMNSAAVHRYAQAAHMVFDDADVVATNIVKAIEADIAERTFGNAEPLYARLNALWPRLFDRLLRKNERLARHALKDEQLV